MTDRIEDILKSSTFKILDGRFVYAKVSKVADSNEYFMVTHDADEITVIVKEVLLPILDIIERNKENYKAIALNVSVPFYLVGFFASVSSAVADQGMNLLIVSTYSKDYILIKEDCLERVTDILSKLGMKEI